MSVSTLFLLKSILIGSIVTVGAFLLDLSFFFFFFKKDVTSWGGSSAIKYT